MTSVHQRRNRRAPRTAASHWVLLYADKSAWKSFWKSAWLVACLAIGLTPATINAKPLIKYRLPNGQIGMTDTLRAVPPGATLLTGRSVALSFDERLQRYVDYARAGDVGEAKALMNRSFVRQADRFGRTALWGAIYHTDLIHDVMTLQADVRHIDNAGNQVLHIAAERAYEEQLAVLLAWRADLDARNGAGQTPLLVALSSKRYDNARFLLDKGATFNAAEAPRISKLVGASADQALIAALAARTGH